MCCQRDLTPKKEVDALVAHSITMWFEVSLVAMKITGEGGIAADGGGHVEGAGLVDGADLVEGTYLVEGAQILQRA